MNDATATGELHWMAGWIVGTMTRATWSQSHLAILTWSMVFVWFSIVSLLLELNSPSLSLRVALRSSSLVMCLWRALSGIVGTEDAAAVWCEDTAAAAATCDWTIDGGRIGLHGECELPEAFDEAANGTPDDEYRSWLNWNKRRVTREGKWMCGCRWLTFLWSMRKSLGSLWLWRRAETKSS